MGNASVYIVKKGDTLWNLAEKYLNDPRRWPEIWHFNNKRYAAQSASMSIRPSMLIKNPDLIFVGQKLLIPTSYDHRQTVQPSLEKREWLLPKIKSEWFLTIKGNLGHYFYAATGYCVAIEIEKLPDIARRGPRPVPVQQPTKAPLKSPGPDWLYIGGVLLLVGAAAVVTATVVEDIVTFGAGVADDPASFTLAATMTARGMTLLRGTQISVTQLGRRAFMAPAF